MDWKVRATSNHRLSLLFSEQRRRDLRPLVGECDTLHGLRPPGARIPIAGVAEVAFFAMQVGVNPRAVAPAIFLGARVRAVPIAARVVPERLQGTRRVRRRGRVARDGLLEFRK